MVVARLNRVTAKKGETREETAFFVFKQTGVHDRRVVVPCTYEGLPGAAMGGV